MKYLLVPAGLLLLVACHSPRKASKKLRQLDTLTVRAFNDPRKIYRAAEPIDWIIKHTQVRLAFNYAARTADGSVLLQLKPYRNAMPDSLHLDAKSMQIGSLRINGQELPFRYDSLKLHASLSRYATDTALEVAVSYTAMPYAGKSGGSSAITDDRGLYFINTDNAKPGKPIQIWTQGETEANSHWMPTIDKPNMRSPFQIELTVPDRYITLSNGSRVSSVKKDTMRTDTWVIKEPIQIYAAMFAIGDFKIVKDQWRDRPVHYYVEPAYEQHAAMMFRHTTEMIEFFSNITGVPYPWEKYHQVVVRDYVSGAMENTSASLFGSFMNQDTREYADNNYEDVVSHELFHQWFGDLVTAESWSNLTVNESFANYGEYLWRRYKYGKDYADRLAWQDLQKYLSTAAYRDPALVRFHYADKEDMFDHVSYQKGGAILHYLHFLLGEEGFSKAMKLYLNKNRLRPAEAVHWRLAVEEADGRDWNWFFDQWYLREGHPELSIQYQNNEATQRVLVTVTQKAPAYRLPLDFRIVGGTASRTERKVLSTIKDTFSFAFEQGQAPLIIPDEAHVLPGSITEEKSAAQWLRQMQQGGDYLSCFIALRKGTKDLKSTESQKLLELALEHQFSGIREAGLAVVDGINNEAGRKRWLPILKHLAEQDNNNRVRAAAIAVLGSWKEASAQAIFTKAVQDSSYFVAGNALYSLHQIKDSASYALARTFIYGKANTNLVDKSWDILAARAVPADTALFQWSAAQHFEPNKTLITNSLDYLQNISNLGAFSAMTRLLGQLLPDEPNESYREYYAGVLKEAADGWKSKKKDPAAAARVQILRSSVAEWKATESSQKVRDVYEAIVR